MVQLSDDVKLKCKAKVGTLGASLSFGAERTVIDESDRLAAQVTMDASGASACGPACAALSTTRPRPCTQAVRVCVCVCLCVRACARVCARVFCGGRRRGGREGVGE